MNTRTIKELISNNVFENIITEVDNFVFVNLDHFTNRLYQSQGASEFIYSMCDYKNHIIVFLLRDGVNCRITGIREVLKKVIAELRLTKETCYIYGYDNLHLDNSTYIEFNVLQMWTDLTYKKIKDLPICDTQFEKKFAALYGRHDIFRLKIFRHLFQYHKNTSLLAFNSECGTYNARFDLHFINDKTWYKENCPVFLDFDTSSTWIPYGKSLETIGSHYNKYFIEIVAETDFFTDKFFTEKTLKNFYLGKPFLLWSGAHSLFRLKEAGFKTFSPYINESYDSIQNTKDRLDAILIEVDRLSKLPMEQLKEIHNQLSERLLYNREFFIQFMLTR